MIPRLSVTGKNHERIINHVVMPLHIAKNINCANLIAFLLKCDSILASKSKTEILRVLLCETKVNTKHSLQKSK